MAWIQMDTDLESKPEYTKLLRLTKVTKAELTRRIFQLWCWIDIETQDGFFPGFDEHDMAVQFEGTEAEFWKKFADPAVNWLEFKPEGLSIPGYEKRFSQCAKRRFKKAKWAANQRKQAEVDTAWTSCGHDVDMGVHLEESREEESRGEQSKEESLPKKSSSGEDAALDEKSTWSKASHDVPVESVTEVADELFRQSKYTGTDGGIFWKAAAVLHVVPGELTRSKLVSIASRAQSAGTRAPGYFRSALRDECKDFEERLRQVWVTPGWPKKPPNARAGPELVSVTLRRAPSSHEPNTNDIAAQLEIQADKELSNGEF